MSENKKLHAAADVVNTTRRDQYDRPLVVLAKCDSCGEEFALLPQHVAIHSKLCKTCLRESKRENARRSK